MAAEVAISLGSNITAIVSMCQSLLNSSAPIVNVQGLSPIDCGALTEKIFKHWPQIFYPVHKKMSIINCYVSTIVILFIVIFLCISGLCSICIQHMYTGNERRMLHTHDVYVFNILAYDTLRHLIPTAPFGGPWIWAWDSHLCQRLRNFLHSPFLPPVLFLPESVIADVVRVCEVAKMLNLASEIAVPDT